MIDKGLTAVQQTRLFPTAVLEWNGFLDDNQTWPQFKSHFTEAYEIWLTTAGGTISTAGYHGTHNMSTSGGNYNDSWQSINEGFMNHIQ